MKINLRVRYHSEAGSILVFFVFAVIVFSMIAGVVSYHTQMMALAHRRADMIDATQLAEGAAALASAEVEKAVTNSVLTFAKALEANSAGAYRKDSTLSNSKMLVYTRVVTAPFTDRSATVQVWFTNSSYPPEAKVIGIATIGQATVAIP